MTVRTNLNTTASRRSQSVASNTRDAGSRDADQQDLQELGVVVEDGGRRFTIVGKGLFGVVAAAAVSAAVILGLAIAPLSNNGRVTPTVPDGKIPGMILVSGEAT